MHYQPKLFQASPYSYCCCAVFVVVGGAHGNGVAAEEFADVDVVLQ